MGLHRNVRLFLALLTVLLMLSNYRVYDTVYCDISPSKSNRLLRHVALHSVSSCVDLDVRVYHCHFLVKQTVLLLGLNKDRAKWCFYHTIANAKHGLTT